MKNVLIFDMDGTILNTITDIALSVEHALKTHHLPSKTLDEVKRSVGKGAKHLIEQVVPKGTDHKIIESVFNSYQTYYDTHAMDHTAPYDGIIDVLKLLKKAGYLLAVVSNKYEYLVKTLNQEVFEGIFDVSVGEVSGIPIKPAPDMIDKALRLLDSERKDAIYIGDSETDMLTAKHANLRVIAVTWGFRTKEELMIYRPDRIIDHPELLIPTIKEFMS